MIVCAVYKRFLWNFMDCFRRNYIVHGRVQGVGFRRFVARCANQCNVGGWVRNCPDGTVEIQVEGESSLISRFIDRVYEGNWFAEVEDIELFFETYTNNPTSEFFIKR